MQRSTLPPADRDNEVSISVDYYPELANSQSSQNLAPQDNNALSHLITDAETAQLTLRLSYFSRHLPRILIDQIMLRLAEKFMSHKVPDNGNGAKNLWSVVSKALPKVGSNLKSHAILTPSIERFYGLLLFVDISGFTSLATKLPVDELRVHINKYFDKIISIVEKYGGQVLKFAGDALFIVWQIPFAELLNEEDRLKDKNVVYQVSQAVECAVQITHSCSDYKISIPHSAVRTVTTTDSNSVERSTNSYSRTSDEDEVVFLNVHAGLSLGTMACMDVGLDERWECLIVGKPLTEVATAESVANKGELVISDICHSVLHPFCNTENADEDGNLPCSCACKPDGCFLIRQSPRYANTQDLLASKSNKKSKAGEAFSEYSHTFLREIQEKVKRLFDQSLKPIMMSESELLRQEFTEKSPHKKAPPESAESFKSNTLAELVHEKFRLWLITHLLSSVVKHVHESSRDGFEFADVHKCAGFREVLGSWSPRSIETEMASSSPIDSTKVATPPTSSRRNSYVNKARKFNIPAIDTAAASTYTKTNTDEMTKHAFSAATISSGHYHEDEADLTSELRNVIVVFIKMNIQNAELFVDRKKDDDRPIKGNESGDGSSIDNSAPYQKITRTMELPDNIPFLQVTSREYQEDQELLGKYQQCMEMLLSGLKEHGGQLRQFIVDDKGTVGIGTFGLRGSVNYDNAAAATEAAISIISKLRSIDVTAGAGITSGKAYCGLVGSRKRHEYAVMSPSTNLSARLMSKTSDYQILCDDLTRQKDRLHNFRALNEIYAKGYTEPVKIFSPVQQQENAIGSGLFSPVGKRNRRQSLKDSFIDTRSSITTNGANLMPSIGRETEIDCILLFLLNKACTRQTVVVPIDNNNAPASPKPHVHYQLNVENPCVVGIVSAPHGMGKSLLLQDICNKISQFPMSSSELQVHIFRKRLTVFTSNEPYYAFRSMFRDAMTVLYNYNSSKDGAKESGNDQAKLVGDEAVLEGTKIVDESLRGTRMTIIPLLASIDFVVLPDGSVTATEKNNPARLLKAVDILAIVFRQFIQITNILPVFCFDDIQWIDRYSWLLLRKIYSDNKGTVVLMTYRKGIVLPNKNSKNASAGNSFVDPHEMFKDPERVLSVDLYPLKQEHVDTLVIEILSRRGFDRKNFEQMFLDRMYQLSGGNPLYVYELSKVVVERALKSEAEHFNFSDCLKNFSNNRIEEVIFFRFDQLDRAGQTVLKIAAVICSFGAVARYKLIYHLVNDSGKHRRNTDTGKALSPRISELLTPINVVDTLKNLLTSGDFIAIVSEKKSYFENESKKGRTTGSVHTLEALRTADFVEMMEEHNVDMVKLGVIDRSVLEVSRFEFKAYVERQTIYDLMLDEQKHYFHRRIGEYYHAKFKRWGDSVHMSELNECAKHFEAAGELHYAMKYYFRSAAVLVSLGSVEESLRQFQKSFMTLQRIKNKLKIGDEEFVILSDDDEGEEGDIRFSKINDAIVSSPRNIQRGVGSPLARTFSFNTAAVVTPTKPPVNKLDIYRIFKGDPELLEIGINIILRYGQTHFASRQDAHMAARIYDELVLFLSAIFGNPNNNSRQDEFKSFSGGITSDGIKIEQFEEFSLRNPRIVFPALVGVIMMYRYEFLHDSMEARKEKEVIDLFLAISALDENYIAFTMFGRCLRRNWLIGRDEMELSQEEMNFVMKNYEVTNHEVELLRYFSVDIVPQTVAMDLQLHVLHGADTRERQEMYIAYLKNILPQIDNVSSLGAATIPFCVSLLLLDRHEDAAHWFEAYYQKDDGKSASPSVFDESKMIFREWIRLATESNLIPANDELIASLLTHIPSAANGNGIASSDGLNQKSIIETGWDFFGIGKELAAANILFYRSNHKKGLDASSYLTAAMAYVDASLLQINMKSQFFVAGTSALQLKCKILQRRLTVGYPKESYEQELRLTVDRFERMLLSTKVRYSLLDKALVEMKALVPPEEEQQSMNSPIIELKLDNNNNRHLPKEPKVVNRNLSANEEMREEIRVAEALNLLTT